MITGPLWRRLDWPALVGIGGRRNGSHVLVLVGLNRSEVLVVLGWRRGLRLVGARGLLVVGLVRLIGALLLIIRLIGLLVIGLIRPLLLLVIWPLRLLRGRLRRLLVIWLIGALIIRLVRLIGPGLLNVGLIRLLVIGPFLLRISRRHGVACGPDGLAGLLLILIHAGLIAGLGSYVALASGRYADGIGARDSARIGLVGRIIRPLVLVVALRGG